MLILRRRTRNCTTAFFVVVSMLFSQLALASYVCPGQPTAEAMVAMMEAGLPCDGMDQAQPVLCHQHSSDSAKTFESTTLPAAAQAVVVQVLVIPWVPEPLAASAVPLTAASEALPPPDPIFFSTLRLRV
jgi:hypothetical protein